MHGNVGSMDGDPAAAYRYTEIRLSAVSEWLLKNIDKETVAFMNNFDDTKKEPTVLPAQFFNLLINGASGISAGYATNIPPFNPNEVCQLLVKLIDHPELKINQITTILPAPDFPTGGTVEISDSLYEAYLTGRGKCSLFANYRVVKGKNHNQIIFDDVPFETNKGNIVKKIDDLITNHRLPHALEVRDESGRDGISIVIDLAKNADPNLIIQYLFKNTDLRINFSINMVVIDQRKPKQLSLIQLFQSFLTHLQKVVMSGFQYDQKQLAKRLEIVNGLLKSLKIIDDIIHLVRHSPNKETMVQKIIKTYDFTANQAEAIVSLQLYRLSNTDQKQLVEEKEEIEQKLHNLNELITNETTFKQHLKTQILTFANQFGYPRKTKIRHEPLHLDLNSKALIVDKKLCYLWMEPNQIKIVEDKKYQLTDLVNNKLKANQTYRDFQTINNKDQLLISTNLGNLILMAVHKLEIKKMNMLPQDLDQIIPLDPHEKVVSVHPIDHTYS